MDGLTRQQLRDKLNMKLTQSYFKRLPTMVKEEQLDKVRKYAEKLQANIKTS